METTKRRETRETGSTLSEKVQTQRRGAEPPVLPSGAQLGGVCLLGVLGNQKPFLNVTTAVGRNVLTKRQSLAGEHLAGGILGTMTVDFNTQQRYLPGRHRGA